MTFDELEFKTDSCCGTRFAATVQRGDGVVIGILRGDEDTSEVSYYVPAGLLSREANVDRTRVEAVIVNCTPGA